VAVDLALDHVIVAVPDLATASEALERRGLRALPGGRHLTLGTENALLPLGGAYVEVVTVADAGVAAGNAFGRAVLTARNGAPRFTGWVLRTDRIEDAAATWQTDVAPLARRTPSGTEVRWRMAGLNRAGDPVRPMVIEWEDPTAAPPFLPADHPAGRVTLARVEIGDPSRTLGTWLPHIDHVVVGASGQPGVQRVVLRVDDRELRLAADAFALP
jgi:glyoxalase-like protein